MKHLIFFIFTFALWNATAQVKFYGSYSIAHKISFNEVFYNGLPTNGIFNFPDFSIVCPLKTSEDPRRSALRFGLEFKRHRMFVELLNDAVSSKYFISAEYFYTPTNSMINYSSYGTSKTFQKRLSLNDEFRLFGKEDHTNLFITASLGLCYRSGPKGILPAGTMGMGLDFSPTMQMESQQSGFTDDAKFAWNMGVGLGTDIHLKNQYLLTFQVNFAYSDQSLYFNENTFRVYKNNSVQEYKIIQKDLCAGVYIGVSRRFHLYPWKPIKIPFL